jgi:hypothetical protein
MRFVRPRSERILLPRWLVRSIFGLNAFAVVVATAIGVSAISAGSVAIAVVAGVVVLFCVNAVGTFRSEGD